MDVRTFLGGHPVAVLVRLAVVSVLVGLGLSFFGVTWRNFFITLDELARRLYDLGFGAIEWLLDYLMLGAMLVLPIWVVMRVLALRGIKTD